jgi:hypothetical protein
MTASEADDDWAAQVEAQRQAKVQQFRESARSPLPVSMRGDGFPGLAYFDPDPSYRFVLPLREHGEKETVTVETTAEGEQTYRRWGEFRFEVDGESATLQAYRPVDGADRFWVPFRDATSGEETYGAGRYLDLEPTTRTTRPARTTTRTSARSSPWRTGSTSRSGPARRTSPRSRPARTTDRAASIGRDGRRRTGLFEVYVGNYHGPRRG